MPGIEFVDAEPEPGADEDLVTGPRHAAPRTRHRRRWIGAAVVAVALAGAVAVAVRVGGVADHPTTSKAVGAPNVLAPEAPSGAFRVDHLGGAVAPEGARAGTLAGQTPTPGPVLTLVLSCPDENACSTHPTLPRAVSNALRAHLPGVVDVLGGSVFVNGRQPTLRSRQITARDGRLSVRIFIAPAAGTTPQSQVSTVGPGSIVAATAIVRGFAVTVTVSGPDTAAPGLATVEALARDKRLVAVG